MQRVEQETGDGHRPNAAGNRRDGAGNFLGFAIGDVANDARLAALARKTIDADIDHGR